MIRILFVDDEPNILDGLRRMLRDMRRSWDMHFAAGGPEAIEMLAKERFDIIVSDMRMPIIDGALLLGHVRKHYPHMTRIILSGHSEKQAIMKSVRLAHQYLAKPCDAESLKKVLQRITALRSLLPSDELIDLITQIEALPSLGRLYSQLLEALDSESSSIESIADMVSQDMGLSATVLKLVNSAFFGLAQHVSSPAQAVSLLGLEVIKGLVLSQGLFAALDTKRVPGMSFGALWQHCLNVGGQARCIIQLEGEDKELSDNAFIAGIMHDVGKLVLATVQPEKYASVIETVRRENCRALKVEKEVLGATHGQAGAYLLGLWGASEMVVSAVAMHESPDYSSALGGSRGRLLLAAVHAADVFEHELCVINPQYSKPKLDRGYLMEANLAGKMETWRKHCADKVSSERENGTT